MQKIKLLSIGITQKEKHLFITLAVASIVYILFTYAFYPADSLHRGFMLNIVLAIIPIVFTLLIYWQTAMPKGKQLVWLWWALWLFTYPNAPYLFTDLVHIQRYEYTLGLDMAPDGMAWLGLVHIFSSVVIGVLWGCFSLYLLQKLITDKKSKMAGWVFSIAICFVCGVGIYIGRFMRFNTWDIFRKPLVILKSFIERLSADTILFFILFSLVTLGGYFLFYICFHTKTEPGSESDKPLRAKGSRSGSK